MDIIAYDKLPENRKIIVDAIYILISNNNNVLIKSTDDKFNISIYIEKICYNNVIKQSKDKNYDRNWDNDIFSNLYDVITSKLLSYFDYNRDNAALIFDYNFDYENILNMKHHDIYIEKYEEYKQLIIKSDIIKVEKKYVKSRPCPKCNEFKLEEKLKQNRSSDEGPSLQMKCDGCGFKFGKSFD